MSSSLTTHTGRQRGYQELDLNAERSLPCPRCTSPRVIAWQLWLSEKDLGLLVKMIRDIRLQHEGKIILRGDAEPSLMALLAAVRKEVPEVEVQQAPVGSHQSIGAAEQKHDHIASQVRVMVTVIQEKAKLVIKPHAYLFPWFVRHAAFINIE